VKPPRAAVNAATKRRKHAACSEVPDSGARPKIPRQGRVSQRRRHDCESARYSGCAFRLVSQKIAALKKWASKSPLGHSRPMQPVLPAGSCPLRSESDLHPACRELTRWANRRHRGHYSITSSASNCIEFGTFMPSDLAVLRLITRSNLVGCMTGRSAGFSPLTIRPT
jgi:hypothetical protein